MKFWHVYKRSAYLNNPEAKGFIARITDENLNIIQERGTGSQLDPPFKTMAAAKKWGESHTSGNKFWRLSNGPIND